MGPPQDFVAVLSLRQGVALEAGDETGGIRTSGGQDSGIVEGDVAGGVAHSGEPFGQCGFCPFAGLHSGTLRGYPATRQKEDCDDVTVSCRDILTVEWLKNNHSTVVLQTRPGFTSVFPEPLQGRVLTFDVSARHVWDVPYPPPPGVRMEMVPSGGTSPVPFAGIRRSSPSMIR